MRNMKEHDRCSKEHQRTSCLTLFISHAAEDLAWAEWIGSTLESAGHKIILYEWDFRPGSNFILEIDRALKESDRVLALLSPAYIFSQYAQVEWAAAFAQDPAGQAQSLIPIRIAECDLDGLLPQVIYIDLLGRSQEEATVLLLEGIAGERRRPEEVAVFPGVTGQAIPDQEASRTLSRVTKEFPAQEEEGFLDLVERGTASLSEGSKASVRFAELIMGLGDKARTRASEFRICADRRGNRQLARYKQVAQRTAKDMKSFVDQTQPELRTMATGWEAGFGAWTRTIEMLPEFGSVDKELLDTNLASIDSVVDSIPRAREAIEDLKQSVQRLQPIESTFIFARNRTVGILDAAVRLLDRISELAARTQQSLQDALNELGGSTLR